MQSKIPIPTPSKLPDSSTIAVSSSQPIPRGKARELIFGNRITTNPKTRGVIKPQPIKRTSIKSNSTSSNVASNRIGKNSQHASPVMKPKTQLVFTNNQAIQLYKTSPYIKGNISNHIKAPCMRNSVSGPPIRRLPVASPTKLPASSLLTESKKIVRKATVTSPSTQTRAINSVGYAVGLHSESMAKLNSMLQKDIEKLDLTIFSLLNKHEEHLNQKERERIAKNCKLDPVKIVSPPQKVTSHKATKNTQVVEKKQENDSKSSFRKKLIKPKSPPKSVLGIVIAAEKSIASSKNIAKKTEAAALSKEYTDVSYNKISSPTTPVLSKNASNTSSPLVPMRSYARPQKASSRKPTLVKQESIVDKEVHPPSRKFDSAPLSKSAIAIPEHATITSMVACQYCSRTFALDRLPAHERVCQKTLKNAKARDKKRMMEQNKKEMEQDRDAKIKERGGIGKAVPKKDWRKAHEELIQNVRAAKEYQRELLAKKK